MSAEAAGANEVLRQRYVHELSRATKASESRIGRSFLALQSSHGVDIANLDFEIEGVTALVHGRIASCADRIRLERALADLCYGFPFDIRSWEIRISVPVAEGAGSY